MPKWLLPWLVPLAMIAGAVTVAVSGWLGAGLFLVLVWGLLPYLRLRYLKHHPPEPELQRRNFWDLRR